MRYPLLIDLESRDGTIVKDGHIQNGFIDGKLVFRRPGINTPLATASGVGQGGIAIGTNAAFVNGDVLRIYNSSGVLQATFTL